MTNLKKLEIEELLDIYKETNSKEAFETLFTICHKQLLSFLLRKKMDIDDAEDLLQNYFILEFKTSIEKYDRTSSKRFINYIKHIVLLRYFTFYKRKKLNESLIGFSLDEKLPNDGNVVSSIIKAPGDSSHTILLIKDEIKSFFREVLFSIKNENHRNAIILRLCLPVKLSTEEIGELLGCKASVYSTWLYRGVLELRGIIKLRRNTIPFDFEELNSFIKEDSFAIKYDTLAQIKEYKVRDILKQFFFAKQDPLSIAKERNESIEDVKLSIRKGIFETLALLRQKSLLFRKGDNMYSDKDDVIQFINDIENLSTGIKLRNSSTTGDKEVDSFLISIYLLFNESNKKDNTKANNFLSRVKTLNLSIEQVQADYNLSINEINSLINGNESDETLLKVKDILNNKEDNYNLNNGDFNILNKKMLSTYYRHNNK